MSRVIVILLCAVLCSCQLWRVDEMLNTAERQMDCAADSALITMRAVKRYAVLTPERRARYGLLYSMVLDKNYIDVASDSLIRYSAQYYDRNGTPTERMRAYYYLGRTQENAKQYDKAILSYLDAAQYADNVDDKYLLALLYSQMGEMYGNHFNYEKGYEYTEKAYNYFKELDSKYQVLMLYRMGRYIGVNQRYNKSIELYNKTLEAACLYEYEELYLLTLKALAEAYVNNLEFTKASKVLKRLEAEYPGDSAYQYWLDYAVAAVIYAHNGEIDKADKFMDKGWRLTTNKRDSIDIKYYHSYYYNLKNNNSKYEYSIVTGALYEHTQLLAQLINSPIDAGQTDYFEQKYALAQQRERTQKVKYIVLLLAVIAALIATLYCINRRSKHKMEDYNTKIAYYVEMLDSMKNTFNTKTKEMYSLLNEMLDGKFNILNEMCQAYYENTNNSKKQLVIFKRVENLISDIQNDKESFVAIENTVNRCRDNILKFAKVEIPSLSDDEYKLMCYVYAGFSTQAIALFFNCNTDAIYNRLSRLRKKIKGSNSTHIEEYLKYLH